MRSTSTMKHRFRWYKWGEYAIVNVPYAAKEYDKVYKMNGYSISKAYVEGVPVYELWKLPHTWLGKFDTAEKAKDKLHDILETESKIENPSPTSN